MVREQQVDALIEELPLSLRRAATKCAPEVTPLGARLLRRRLGRHHLWNARFRSLGLARSRPIGEPVEVRLAVVNIKPSDGGADAPFGSLDEVVTDLRRLGVRRLRQVGDYDLVWSRLAADSGLPSAGTGGREPVLPADRANLRAVVLSERNIDRLADLLRACRASWPWMRPRWMFFSPGGGYAPSPAYLEVGGLPETWYHVVDSPVASYWEEPEEGVERTTSNSHVSHGRIGPVDALSVENGYDVDYLCELAVLVAELLVRAHERLGDAHHTLAEVTQGIELMNELQSRNLIRRADGSGPDISASGLAWGRALYRIARAFQVRFQELGIESPAIYLPGNLSYGDPQTDEESGVRWSSQIVWLQAACWGAWEGAHDEDDRSLDDVFAGIDHHWYHCHGDTYPCVPRPMVSLLWEVRCIRECLAAFGMVSAEVSVFESGVRAELMWAEPPTYSAGPAPSDVLGYSDFLPSLYPPDDAESPSRFQANEVWRRLAGALVAGAAVQGIHTFMATYAGAGAGSVNSFALFGLRADGADVDHQCEALQRSGWHRLARWADLTGRWGGVVRAGLVLPAIDVDALDANLCLAELFTAFLAGSIDPLEYEACLGRMQADSNGTAPVDEAVARHPDLVVVELEYAGGEGVAYGYVVFVDPWNNAAGYCVSWRKPSGARELTEHRVDESGGVSAVPPHGHGFPREVVAYDEWTVDPGATLAVAQNDPPRFFTSDTRVEWEVVVCPPDAGKLGDPPEIEPTEGLGYGDVEAGAGFRATE